MAEEQRGDGDSLGLVGQVVNTKNLVLLRKSDRLVILAAGLVVVGALGAIATVPGEPVIALLLSLASMVIVAGAGRAGRFPVAVVWRQGGRPADPG